MEWLTKTEVVEISFHPQQELKRARFKTNICRQAKTELSRVAIFRKGSKILLALQFWKPVHECPLSEPWLQIALMDYSVWSAQILFRQYDGRVTDQKGKRFRFQSSLKTGVNQHWNAFANWCLISNQLPRPVQSGKWWKRFYCSILSLMKRFDKIAQADLPEPVRSGRKIHLW